MVLTLVLIAGARWLQPAEAPDPPRHENHRTSFGVRLMVTLAGLGAATVVAEALFNEWVSLAFTTDLGTSAAVGAAAITVCGTFHAVGVKRSVTVRGSVS